LIVERKLSKPSIRLVWILLFKINCFILLFLCVKKSFRVHTLQKTCELCESTPENLYSIEIEGFFSVCELM
jgi:hypothetical protein